MNKPKLFACMVLFVLASFLFAGCSNDAAEQIEASELIELLVQENPAHISSENDAEKQLRFWTFHQSQEFEFMESLGELYETLHPDVEIKVEYVPLDDYFGTRLISSFATGQGPDIFLVSPGTLQKFADARILYPLTSRFTKEIKQDFYEDALENVTIEQEIMAVPFEVELLGLYYNKQMFQKHNLSPPRTWEDMANAAERLRTEEVTGLTIEPEGSFYQNFTWLPFLWQTGAYIVDAFNERSGLHEANAVKMYTFFEDMRKRQLLNLYPSRPTNDIGIIANGETAMQVAGTWNIRLLESTYQDVPIGVVPLPIPEGGQPATISGGWKVGVNRHSENLQEAADFVMWAFAEEVSHSLKWCTDIKFAYSPRKSVMAARDDISRGELRQVFAEQILPSATPEPSYSDEINRIFTESLQNILFNHYSGEDAAREASESIDEFLQQYSSVK